MPTRSSRCPALHGIERVGQILDLAICAVQRDLKMVGDLATGHVVIDVDVEPVVVVD